MEALMRMAKKRSKITSGRLFVLTLGVKDTQRLVLLLNKENQLRAGKLSDGSFLPVYKNDPGKRWTLHDTGYFYSSFEISQLTEEFFTIDADGLKPGGRDWTKYADGNVLGLNQDSMSILVRKVIPIMRKVILTELLS